jgi:ABC-type glycerol-3-phosphate transport system substrate-binding protein
MRKSAALALMFAAAIGLAACSERTPDSAANTAADPGPGAEGADAIGNAAVASAAASEAADN